MASRDDDPPEQEIIPPGSHELDTPIPRPAGVIKSAFFTAIEFGMQGRAVAAYKGAVREAVDAVDALRDLDYAVADRKKVQLILENFDALIAEPALDHLHTLAAEAKTDRLKAETVLYKEELHSREERATAEAKHREAMGKSQEQTERKKDAFDPNNLSREEYEVAQRIDARARRASGEAGKKTTTRNIYAVRDMLKARNPKDDTYCAAVDAAAEEAIKDLGLDADDSVIHL